jgi:ABC-type phosphate transport system substrate-binding protein
VKIFERRSGRIIGAGLAIAALITGVTGAANATAAPRVQLVVGLGSDTTETLFDQLATDYNRSAAQNAAGLDGSAVDVPAQHAAGLDGSAVRQTITHGGSELVTNYWATGPSPIVTKPGCAPIARPNGSSPGIAALAARGTGADGSPCIDFVRSIAPRSPGAPADSVFYPVAQDAVDYAVNTVTNAPAMLTTPQIKDILECTVTRWDQVGGTSHDTIQPYLPDLGPGLLGLLHRVAGVDKLGPCVGVSQQDSGVTPQVRDNQDALAFYSIGKYIGQAVYHIADVHGELQLGDLDGVAPTVRNPATGRIEINLGQVPGIQGVGTSLRIPEWVAIRRNADGSVPPTLAALFSGPDSWVCSSPVARSDIQGHGFLPLPETVCGAPS